MKKCPKCKAEIEENARFCLYCMTSFEEKQSVEVSKENKKLWMYIVTAVFVLVLIVFGVFLLVPKDKAKGTSIQNSRVPSVSSEPNNFNDNKNTVQSDKPSSSEKENSSANKTSNSTNVSGSGSAGISSGGSSQDKTSSGSSTVSSGSSSSSGGSASSDKAEGSSSTTNSSTTSSATTTAIYLYRDAVPADDYTANPSITNNAVVITGVKVVSGNGIYEIPSTIDGKNVVAITESAFCADEIKNTVKQVIIPSTVKTINAHAFYKCYNLTDIYLKGSAVACPSVILPDKNKRNFEITIHASLSCHDRNFHTYKTLCTYWETKFVEWNG